MHRDSVIMIKCGTFYEVLTEEAFLMNNIFNYKIREFGKTFHLGFPISVIKKVTDRFDELEINYVIVDKEAFDKNFKNNKYNLYLEKNTDVIKKSKKEQREIKINEKFRVLGDIKKLIMYVENIVKNFPKSEVVLKNRIINDLYNILENNYLANYSNGKTLYQNEVIIKLKMIDFYVSYKKMYLSPKQYTQVGNYLIRIIKEISIWKNNETIK